MEQERLKMVAHMAHTGSWKLKQVYSTHISSKVGFHSRLKSKRTKSEKVLNTGLTDVVKILFIG